MISCTFSPTELESTFVDQNCTSLKGTTLLVIVRYIINEVGSLFLELSFFLFGIYTIQVTVTNLTTSKYTSADIKELRYS